MTPTDVVKLTRLVKAVCPAQQIDEYTADAWAHMIDDLDLTDATTAVKTLGQRQVFIAVSEIRAEVNRIRADRIDRTQIHHIPAGLADDPPAYITWLRHTRHAIADGTYIEPDQLDPTRHRPIAAALERVFRRTP